MISTRLRIAATMMSLAMLALSLAGCFTPAQAADNYMAVVPSVLQANSEQSVSVALFRGNQTVAGAVELSLLKDGSEIARAKDNIRGNGTLKLTIPDVAEGDYSVRIKVPGFEDEGKVRVENRFVMFLETDKPIYKPGQTVHIRALTLSSDLRPVTQPVIIDVLDAKGIKVFRATVNTDDFGMASADLPLSTEPNLGVWKLTAISGNAKSQLDVRVEEYVLPKYEVKVDLPRDWFLVNEAIKGKITAEYSFGKPVKGQLEIKALRYVGQWQQFATFTKEIDGSAEFTIPAPGYVAGVPAAGGSGNVQLDVSVVEKSTGYQEKTSRLLTVAQSSTVLQMVPSGTIFKPGLPFKLLVITQTPGKEPVDVAVNARITYLKSDFKQSRQDTRTVNTVKGKAILEITPPADAAVMTIDCNAGGMQTSKTIEAGYSPSGNFINLEQVSEGTPGIGDEIRFKVNATEEAANFYYEVISRGRVVFSDYTRSREITIKATPLMSPTSRLLVYQILPNAEVAADYLPFKVNAQYPQAVTLQPSQPEARPGDKLTVNIQTDGEAMVGLAGVDRSVFILAENRVNLQQVFDELEKLYMKPQAELHEVTIYEPILNRGAKEVFRDAGVVVLTKHSVPEGKEIKNPAGGMFGRGPIVAQAGKAAVPPMAAPAPSPTAEARDQAQGGLAEVQRLRQFFPETWLWQTLKTDARGSASVPVTAPDSITTWMLRAVALSKKSGLGIAESQLKVFQPFFVSVDLPYSAIRGEEFPVKVAVYNYLDKPQNVLVQIEKQDWFELLDSTDKSVNISPNDIGGVSFKIRPSRLGTNSIKITARSPEAADAVEKTIIIDPEGVSREIVDNMALTNGFNKTLSTGIPRPAVNESGRAFLSVTASSLTQTINGLEALLQMPFGCGEQNMIVFAPDVYITRYLRSSGQLKVEIMAKAEKLMVTGYQRELTYRRSDGSFSAFGQSDKEGSIWLTSFVMKSFAQAKDIIFIDPAVLDLAKGFITKHQNADGSFDPVGFVVHKEMMGGLTGKQALTAYIAAALMVAGDKANAGRAVSYLEGKLDEMNDPYTVAITAYALEMAKSTRAGAAYDKLMKLAKEDANGLYWGNDQIQPQPASAPAKAGFAAPGIMPPQAQKTALIETTAYATMALVKHGDVLNAGKAARWLTSKRNAYGGYGSTQDTVVALEALVEQASNSRADVDLTVTIKSGSRDQQVRIRPENFDILQVVEVPIDGEVTVSVQGKGDAVAQLVRRYNVPEVPKADDIIKIKVDYDATEVAVNDLVKVSARLDFNPPINMEAGMIVMDISVPTGFQAVRDSITKAIAQDKRIKRFDISGRKVIFYIENLQPGDSVSLSFMVQALYPVKAKGVTSQAYSYYKPELAGESLSLDISVVEK